MQLNLNLSFLVLIKRILKTIYFKNHIQLSLYLDDMQLMCHRGVMSL